MEQRSWLARPAWLWVFWALMAAILHCSSGEVLPKPTPDKMPNGTNALHIRGFPRGSSQGAAITKELRKRKGAENTFFRLVQVLENAVSETNCLLNGQAWISAVESNSHRRGWVAPLGDCNSVTTAREHPLDYTPSETFGRLTDVADIQDSITKKVVSATGVNFARPTFPRSFLDEGGTSIKHKCIVERNTALRVNTSKSSVKWFMLTGFTNEKIDVTKKMWERQFVTEFVGMDLSSGKFIDPLEQFVVPVGKGNEGKLEERKLAATVWEKWAGRVGLSGVFAMTIEEAPGLQAAWKKMDVDVDQATDAVTPSNTAILALPMAINLIPVSLLADVSGFGLLFYTLLTDVLTTVPFIIKGFELIFMGNKRYVDHAGWFRGTSDDPSLVLEFWAAECRILKVHQIGIIYVVIGFLAMVAGIVTELWARQLRKRWAESSTRDQTTFHNLKVAILGADVPRSSKTKSKDQPEFDPDDEDAAFAAQQAATRRRMGSGAA